MREEESKEREREREREREGERERGQSRNTPSCGQIECYPLLHVHVTQPSLSPSCVHNNSVVNMFVT